MRKFVIGGNWKMNKTVPEAVETARALVQAVEGIDSVDIFIAPPATALAAVSEVVGGTNVKLAAQNMHFKESGAYTGEISPIMLKDVGCDMVILGHSERRRIFGEDDELINKKVLAALEHGITPVLCIGETAKERADGRMVEVNESQLEGSLAGVSAEDIKKIVIAYEPVWAINNPALNPGVAEIKAATPQEAEEAHVAIRSWLKRKYGDEVAQQVRVQYGGSMKPANAESLLSIPDIDGGLVGGASLKADSFSEIIKIAQGIQK